jgi:hypothetical protein
MKIIKVYKGFKLVLGAFGNVSAPEANVFISPLGDDLPTQIMRAEKAVDLFILRHGMIDWPRTSTSMIKSTQIGGPQ